MIFINKYLKNFNRIEFIVTYACTGRCKHCSEGDHSSKGVCLDKDYAKRAVYDVASNFNITSVMTFGGEPLLYPEVVFEIHSTATKLNIPRRQLITNGYFSVDADKIRYVANGIYSCGVNDLLLSVDAFHQETIPLDIVKFFATELKKLNVPLRTSPAWLVSPNHNNPYNLQTKKILKHFKDLGIEESSGNIVFPGGNATKYLKEYLDFSKANPYEEEPNNIKSISIEPDGLVLGKSIYKEKITKILNNYNPCEQSERNE